MTVNTNLFRHLSARWLIRESNANNIYCGVSQILMLDNYDPNPFNESFDRVTEAINSCTVFAKVNSSFVKEAPGSKYDVKLLTKQVYSKDNIVKNHTFLDNVQHWKYITPEEALGSRSYNTILSFVLKNIDADYDTLFQNLRTFYFFYNLKINGQYPTNMENNNKYFQIIPNPGDTITADGIILLDKLAYVYNEVDHGVCERKASFLSVPLSFQNKINYFISF